MTFSNSPNFLRPLSNSTTAACLLRYRRALYRKLQGESHVAELLQRSGFVQFPVLRFAQAHDLPQGVLGVLAQQRGGTIQSSRG